MSSENRTGRRVFFRPSGRHGRFDEGTSVLEAARALGVDLDSVCGGRGICGRCQITVAEGEFAREGIRSDASHLSAPGEPEARYEARQGLIAGRRLGCHARLLGDVVIDVPADSQVHQQVVRKEHESRDIEVDPVLHLYFVSVAEPRLEEPSGDAERLLAALQLEWGLESLTIHPDVLAPLQTALREGGWRVTVAVRDGTEVVAARPGFHGRALGVAIDVGSTTLAATVCDLTTGEPLATVGAMNPQIRFGEDLMSRVSYAMLNEGGAQRLTAAVHEALGELLRRVATRAGAGPSDIFEVTLVGNPVMHHLVLGLDPTPLGSAPFALATDRSVSVPARQLGMQLDPGARAWWLPCIAGHVGADTAGMLLAEAPWESEATTLLVDVGTNAEIVLGNRDRLLAASSPTGPAFEGAQISCGQRAAPGAIERVRIDRDTLEPRFRVIGCELWSNEPGFAEAADSITGICGSGIIEAVAEMFLAGIVDADGAIDGSFAERTARLERDGRTWAWVLHEGEPRVRITQNDIRAIQLAKGALYAGIRLLMDRLGIDHVDRIRLAGAFGSHIDPTYAMVLGMIPDCDLAEVSAAGNAAGTGARVALLNRAARAEIEARVRTIEKVETATEERFQQHFVHAMALPNKVEPFPRLAAAVALPERPASESTPSGRRGGRRRRRGRQPS